MRKAKAVRTVTRQVTTLISPGDRVIIQGAHPWCGHTGVFVENRKTMLGEMPVVRLDSGQEFFVMQPNQWRKV
jgi:hypothetical protein